jgi:hypothetical protein
MPVAIRTIAVTVYPRTVPATVVMGTTGVAIDPGAVITPLPAVRLFKECGSLHVDRVFG